MLLDWVAYAEAKGIEWSPFSPGRIGVSDMEAVARHQGVTFRPGDILIVRFGLTEQLDGLSGQEQGLKYMTGGGVGGVEGSEEVARWLWDQHFAAIASDNNAVEALPPMKDGQPRPFHELGEWNPPARGQANAASSASMVFESVWSSLGRAVGFEGRRRAMSEASAIHLFPDFGAAECAQGGWKPA